MINCFDWNCGGIYIIETSCNTKIPIWIFTFNFFAAKINSKIPFSIKGLAGKIIFFNL